MDIHQVLQEEMNYLAETQAEEELKETVNELIESLQRWLFYIPDMFADRED